MGEEAVSAPERSIVLHCAEVSKTSRSHSALVYVDRKYRTTIKPSETTTQSVAVGSNVAVISSGASGLWWLLLVYPGLLMEFVHWLIARTKPPLTETLKRLSVSVPIDWSDPDQREFEVSTHKAGWKSIRVVFPSPDRHVGSPASTRDISVELGESYERVVYDVPVDLTEGDVYSREVEITVSRGIDVSTMTTASSIEMDAGFLTAAIEKHYGQDRVEREKVEHRVTDTFTLTGKPGGSRCSIQWVEEWRRGVVTDGVEVYGSFTFRERHGPRIADRPL